MSRSLSVEFLKVLASRALAQAVRAVWRRHRSRVTDRGDAARSACITDRLVHHLLPHGAGRQGMARSRRGFEAPSNRVVGRSVHRALDVAWGAAPVRGAA